MSLEKDANFVNTLMTDFFKQKHIKQRLAFFNEDMEYRVKGWETWWQIEFAYYIDKIDVVAEWYREFAYDIDKRKLKTKNKAIIDFAIRKKHSSASEYIGIELKLTHDFEKCVTSMIRDHKKINSIKKSDLKSILTVGLFLQEKNDYEELEDKIEEKLGGSTENIIYISEIKFQTNSKPSSYTMLLF